MTDVIMTRGDTVRFELTILATPTGPALDLTNAILAYSLKRRANLPDSEATVQKTSSGDSGIVKVDAINGRADVNIAKKDTNEQTVGAYCWGIEVVFRGTLRSAAGLVDLVAGSDVVTFSNPAAIANAEEGDYLEVSGANAPNQVEVVVTETPETDETLNANQLRVRYSGWEDETGVSFSLYEATTTTPAELQGSWTLSEDVVNP